jgi:hypothetical protein
LTDQPAELVTVGTLDSGWLPHRGPAQGFLQQSGFGVHAAASTRAAQL